MSSKSPPKLLILMFLTISLLTCFSSHACAAGEPKRGQFSKRVVVESSTINGMFVFGSSLVDNGNNNFLRHSLATADYLPYGVDFPLGPTGRFTNGKNVIDLIGDLLKLPLIPPFLDPSTKGDKIVHGVNFASAASGILDDTGLIAGHVMSLNQQLKNFEEVTLGDLETQLGIKSQESLPNYLFVLGSGGNDYSFNYFLKSKLNPHLSLQDFTSNLISTYYTQIKRLYDLGGRKFVVMSVNPLGCYPVVLAKQLSSSSCNEAQNQAAELFNANMVALVDLLKKQLAASNFVFVNSYNIITAIMADLLSKGFEEAVRSPCCGLATLLEGGNGSLCKKGGEACEDRNSHVFFDGVHPTQAVNSIIATKAFSSQDFQREVYPINIQQLLQL